MTGGSYERPPWWATMLTVLLTLATLALIAGAARNCARAVTLQIAGGGK